jgi:hypothetical protein
LQICDDRFMLICMKPTRKQLDDLTASIAQARSAKNLSDAEISRICDVHPSQIARICGGNFKTFSHSVMQICKVLDVSVPRLEPRAGDLDREWARAQASMRKLWDETPEGAKRITRMLDAIGELNTTRARETPGAE